MRLKLRVSSIDMVGGAEKVSLQTVPSGAELPAASLTLYIDNPYAQGIYKPGMEYNVDISLSSLPRYATNGDEVIK